MTRTISFLHPAATAARAGLTAIELTIAVAVLAVLLATSLKMVFAVSNQLRSQERRNLALATVQAVSEQIENIPFDQLTTESAQVAIPEPMAARLSGAKLSVVIQEETDPPAKRINVELTWNGRGQERPEHSSLTCWAFPDPAPTRDE